MRLVGSIGILTLCATAAVAEPTLNGWDTSKIYVLRNSLYSDGSPQVPPNSIQVLDESNLLPRKPFTRFGEILVFDDLDPKTFTFSNSPRAGASSPPGARMFLAQAWPAGGNKTDISVWEYGSDARLLRRSYLGSVFGFGAGQLVRSDQPNNRVSIGAIRYNPRKDTLAVSATLVTNNGARIRGTVLEFQLPAWPEDADGLNVPAVSVTAVQVYEAPAGHTINANHPLNIDFDDDGNLYMTGKTFDANGVGGGYKSDVVKVGTVGLTGGLTPHVVRITGADADNLLIEGSLEAISPPEHDYGSIYTLAVRTATQSIMVLPRKGETLAEPTLEYSLTSRGSNGNLAFARNWGPDPSGLGVNSQVYAGQRDYESGAVFISCFRGDPGGGPKRINANGTIDVIGWRNWDVASPPPLPVIKPTADTDGDGDVDQADFGFFQVCYTGQGTLLDADGGCQLVDFDQDRDVDPLNFNVFVGCLGGPNRPPGC